MDKTKYFHIRTGLNFSSKARGVDYLGDLFFASLSAAPLVLGISGITAPVAVLSLSILFFRSFGRMHEAVHGSLCRNRKLNDGLGHLYGVFCVLPYRLWKDLHLQHHNWSGNFDRDPVMALVRTFSLHKDLGTREKVYSFLWRAWIPVLAYLQMLTFWKESLKLLKKSQVLSGFFSATPLIFWGAVAAAAPWPYLLAIVLPAALIYLMMIEAINLPHHLSIEKSWGEDKYPLPDQHVTARTCTYPLWFNRMVLLNFNYHVEHHLFPNLSQHELPKASVMVKDALGNRYQSCAGFEWVVVNRKKNLRAVILDESLTPSAVNRKPA